MPAWSLSVDKEWINNSSNAWQPLPTFVMRSGGIWAWWVLATAWFKSWPFPYWTDWQTFQFLYGLWLLLHAWSGGLLSLSPRLWYMRCWASAAIDVFLGWRFHNLYVRRSINDYPQLGWKEYQTTKDRKMYKSKINFFNLMPDTRKST